MNLNHFTLKIENKVAQLAISRPDKANSLHQEAWQELKAALLYCDRTPEVRAIVLSGAGDKLFSAGIDLTMLMSINELMSDDCEGRKREKFRNFLLDFQDILSTAEKISKPILSAVHGGCIGGGQTSSWTQRVFRPAAGRNVLLRPQTTARKFCCRTDPFSRLALVYLDQSPSSTALGLGAAG